MTVSDGENGPNGFTNYLSLYEETYDAVKKISPETKVFCIFAREIVSENREANLEGLRLFNTNKIDLLVFTSYPYAHGKTSPSMIPDDYYSKAAIYMPGKLFGFIEIAGYHLMLLEEKRHKQILSHKQLDD
ncbi:MAG: hypothetical protein NUV92_02520 [Ignavibacteria bacterium]|jgi:arabinogalactan endo-1,4-beta-galactosidase|nr:hypothetical protein [Ignavibacteria bacterium]MDH7527108.1 hypothetical protein [Ignavibacteria bacterium]